MIEIKMSTVVLVLNQDGISELIQIANDIQERVDVAMNANDKPKDRVGDAAGPSTFLEVAKEKLPMILEEGDEDGTTVSSSELTSFL
jgi:hypothetical protein